MRIGLMEIHDFCLEYFPGTRSATFLSESCGVADIMTSCEHYISPVVRLVTYRSLQAWEDGIERSRWRW